MKFIEILVVRKSNFKHHELPIRNHTMKSPFLFLWDSLSDHGRNHQLVQDFATTKSQFCHRENPPRRATAVSCSTVSGRSSRGVAFSADAATGRSEA
jgi:hypothetical protein